MTFCNAKIQVSTDSISMSVHMYTNIKFVFNLLMTKSILISIEKQYNDHLVINWKFDTGKKGCGVL